MLSPILIAVLCLAPGERVVCHEAGRDFAGEIIRMEQTWDGHRAVLVKDVRGDFHFYAIGRDDVRFERR